MQVNIPWQEPATGAKPCPKCGKTDPHYRRCVFYKETDAVCCGGEGCGFYQAATSREKALEKWNKTTTDTPDTPDINPCSFIGEIATNMVIFTSQNDPSGI